MKAQMKKLALATFLAFTATASQAAILIDNFNDPFAAPGQTVTSDGTPATVSDTDTGLTGVLGGSRELTITCNTGCFDNDPTTSASLGVSNGTLKWVNGTSVRSTASITWDANGSGLGFDILAAGSNIVATILAADLGFNYTLTLYSIGGYTSLISGTVTAVKESAPEDAVYNLNWFTFADGSYYEDNLPFDIVNFGTGVDLHQISKINLTLNNVGSCYVESLPPNDSTLCSTAVDLRIDDARVVPEPGSIALVGLGLLGLGALRRRKQQA